MIHNFYKGWFRIKSKHLFFSYFSGRISKTFKIFILLIDKKYSLFGSLFNELWEIAKQEIVKSNEIIIIGYSFPITDVRTIKLFKEAFCKKQVLPRIIIVNPEPNDIVELFQMTFGVPIENITIYKEYFDKDFNFDKISNK